MCFCNCDARALVYWETGEKYGRVSATVSARRAMRPICERKKRDQLAASETKGAENLHFVSFSLLRRINYFAVLSFKWMPPDLNNLIDRSMTSGEKRANKL